MKNFKPISDSIGRWVLGNGLTVLVCLAFIGCAQFTHQTPEQLPFMERAQTKTDGGIRVTAAVPSAEESEQIFGFPLANKNIQPVWLEIENNSDTDFFLFHVAMDPDLFSSGEVAWKFQSSLYSKKSQKHIYNLFRHSEIEWYYQPGSVTSGFVFTNL